MPHERFRRTWGHCGPRAVSAVAAEEADVQGHVAPSPFLQELSYRLWFTGKGVIFACFYLAVWPDCSLLRNPGLDQVQLRKLRSGGHFYLALCKVYDLIFCLESIVIPLNKQNQRLKTH